jgi:hypothetical protein
MTVVAAIPMIFYVLYKGALHAAKHPTGSGKNRGQAAAFAMMVAIVSYIVYLITQMIALLISRYREYWADEFSAETTRQPDKLASALVKIAYGLAREGEGDKSDKDHKKYQNALMIFNAELARALAAKGSGADGKVDPENIKKAMAWDLWNPWAFFLELQCSHPLPAKRINTLDKYAQDNALRSYINFDLEPTESYVDDFLKDIFMASLCVWAIPLGILLGIFVHPIAGFGAFMVFFCLFLAIFMLSYHFPLGFREKKVENLLVDIKVSPVLGRPVKLKGRIIGRGQPGLFFSEDLKLDDGTGLILLDYHQVAGIVDLLVGIFATEDKIGKEVEVMGWYRRKIIPYVEIYKIKYSYRWKQMYTTWVYYMVLIIFAIIGLLIMAWGFMF